MLVLKGYKKIKPMQTLKRLILGIALAVGLSSVAPVNGQTPNYYKQAQESQEPLKKIELYTKAIEQKPDNDALFERGWAYLDQNKFNLAIKDFKNALNFEGTKAKFDILGSLSFGYYALAKYEEALNYANQSLTLKPEHTYSLYYRGWANVELGKWEDGEKDFTTFIGLIRDNANGFYARQYVYYKRGDYQKALADIDKALAMNPTNRKYIEAKILILNRLGQSSQVDSLLGKIVNVIQDDPLSLANIGNVFYGNNDAETALQYHNRAVELYNQKIKKDPKFAQTNKDALYNIYLSRGNAYLMLKKSREALADFVRATDVKPQEHIAWNRIGQLQTFEKNYREAVRAYERCFALNPTYEVGWVNLGFSLSELGMRQEAINVYNRALKIEKVDSRGLLLNNRGFCYLELKNLPRAYDDIKQSIENDSEIPMSHISMGEYYIEAKKYKEAIEKFNQALEMENKSAKEMEVGIYKRGLAFLLDKQPDEALKDFERVLRDNPQHILANEKAGIAYYDKKEYCTARNFLLTARRLGYKNPKEAPRQAEEYIRRCQTETPKPCPEIK